MAQFDICLNNGPTKSAFPCLLVLQSSLFRGAERWVVIPLVPGIGFAKQDPRLSPVLKINGAPFLLATQSITNVPVRQLGEVVGSARKQAETIIAAVDWLMNRGWD
ncbi:plasmid maintenance protein CcdB [Aerophototrophica crusticola]|uniref:Toxin CcdB n=1 Tax=Aerophototrophica crusticola TaxID=1709002 RepID=A0A858R418_9PROT|nr:plasmid maintenance protein CcdB [Rhodospirillaceae bacterium B3]